MKRIYLDGNSLGPPGPDLATALTRFVEDEWRADLIGGWNGHGWWDLPLTLGDRIAPLVGAAPGQVVVGDTTTVLWFKLLVAAVRLRPGARWIVTEEQNFPTDRHVIDAVAAAHGLSVEAVPAAELEGALCGETAVLALTHVNYRTGARHDLAGLTRAAHAHGALASWDLSHSVGAMDLALDSAGVDLAVGCTYKYLNGGPGAPAFAYVADRHLAAIDQPIPGWVGHADPFSMDETHRPATGIRRMLSGTPHVIGLKALGAALDSFDGLDLVALRSRSVELTERFIAGADARLADWGFEVVTPRVADERGSHVSLRHDHAWEIVQALIGAGVIGDYREPGLCRFGFAPLYLTTDEVDEAVDRIVEVMRAATWEPFSHVARPTVT